MSCTTLSPVSAATVGVPAHPVKHEQQRGIFGHHYSGAVLVVLAITESGNFGVFDLHAGNVVALGGEQSLECRPS